MSLEIKKLNVTVGKKEILSNLSLTIKPGEIHAIMGPNGSGKSTLANTLAGHPKYTITGGKIVLDKIDLTTLSPDKRARAGIFLSMQHPPEIPGVTVSQMLRLATEVRNTTKQNPITFHRELTKLAETLAIDPSFLARPINTGFSGGEKKKAEILQLLQLNPKYAILDETDSGLDVDALKIVSKGINAFHTKKNGVLLITHYNRILQYVVPDFVHIMVAGKIVKSGDKELAKEIEKSGYKKYL